MDTSSFTGRRYHWPTRTSLIPARVFLHTQGQRGSSHTCQAFYGPGKKDWEMGLWFGVVEIFGNLTGDGLCGYFCFSQSETGVGIDRKNILF